MDYHRGTKYLYVLDSPVVVSVDIDVVAEIAGYITLSNRQLTIHPGYAWDGASGAIDTQTIMRAALVHDALYQLMREDRLGSEYFHWANRVFRRLMLEDGVCKFRAWYVYMAVELFGRRFA